MEIFTQEKPYPIGQSLWWKPFLLRGRRLPQNLSHHPTSVTKTSRPWRRLRKNPAEQSRGRHSVDSVALLDPDDSLIPAARD